MILSVAPSVAASQYREFSDDLFAFFSRLIASGHPADQFLVVVDHRTLREVGDSIPQQNLLPGLIPDIWIRDFAPVHTATGSFKFRYEPAYLKKRDAQFIERGFMGWLHSVGLETEPVELILDGGNLVYNGVDRAVVTERVLQDNPSRSRQEISHELQTRLGLDSLAIIPQEPGEKTGHADGMVVWLAERVLGVSQYREPLRSRVLSQLEQALPGTELTELPYTPTSEITRGWWSAAGVYVNALSTENALYVPQFGLEADRSALCAYCSFSPKKVIPVRTGREVRLGGSIHCLTWELTEKEAWRVLESRE